MNCACTWAPQYAIYIFKVVTRLALLNSYVKEELLTTQVSRHSTVKTDTHASITITLYRHTCICACLKHTNIVYVLPCLRGFSNQTNTKAHECHVVKVNVHFIDTEDHLTCGCFYHMYIHTCSYICSLSMWLYSHIW